MSEANPNRVGSSSTPFIDGLKNEEVGQAPMSLDTDAAVGTSQTTEEDKENLPHQRSSACELDQTAQEVMIENLSIIHNSEELSSRETSPVPVINTINEVNSTKVETSSTSSSSTCFLARMNLMFDVVDEDTGVWNNIGSDGEFVAVSDLPIVENDKLNALPASVPNKPKKSDKGVGLYGTGREGSDSNDTAVSGLNLGSLLKHVDAKPNERGNACQPGAVRVGPRPNVQINYPPLSNLARAPPHHGNYPPLSNLARAPSRHGAFRIRGINSSNESNDGHHEDTGFYLPEAQPLPHIHAEVIPICIVHAARVNRRRGITVLADYSFQMTILSAFIFITLAVVAAVLLRSTENNSTLQIDVKSKQPSASSILPPSPFATKEPEYKTRLESVYDVLVHVSGEEVLSDETSYQYFFMRWIAQHDEAQISIDDVDRLIQRYVVSLFYSLSFSWEFLDARNECDWNTVNLLFEIDGVQCDSEGHVTSLHFSMKQWATKPIPYEIEFLSHLTFIHFDHSFNDVSLPLPTSIWNLSQLEVLKIFHNDLSGQIPSEIGNLSNLLHLDLSSNLYHGSIPSEIGLLTNIETIHLASNELTGSIPSKIAMLTNLTYLDLSDNHLTGMIPSSLFEHLPNMKYLNLQDNIISGTLSTSLGNALSLEHIFLFNNKLEGTIPHEIGMLTNLVYLGLGTNSLTNTIPTSLCNLSNLVWLHLNDNFLTGSIPTSLETLPMLKWLCLSKNALAKNITLPVCQLESFGKRKPLSIESSSPSSTILHKVNVGGSLYVDTYSNKWCADQFYSVGSWGYDYAGETTSTTNPISNTDDDALYQTDRSSPSFEYKFDNLPDGKYQVNVLLAEVHFTESNMRKMNIIVEGELMLCDYDIVANVGHNSAKLLSFYTNVLDNQLNILMQATEGDAKVCALEVIWLGENLFINGGFERGTDGWVPQSDGGMEISSQKKNGIYSVLASQYTFQRISGEIQHGSVYEISGWVKLKRLSSMEVFIYVEQIGSAPRVRTEIGHVIAVNTGWVKAVGSFMLNVTGNLEKLIIGFSATQNAELFFDDLSVVAK